MAKYCENDYSSAVAVDTNDATTFANRVQSTRGGFTAARIAPGEDMRVMKSPKGSLTGCAIGYVENASLDASTDVITANGHPFENDEPIFFLYGSTVSAGSVYYVRDVTANTFKCSTTRGGGAVNFGTSGTVHVGSFFVKVPNTNHKMITDCASATNWTGGTNVTPTASATNALYWSNCILLTVGASPATGRLALYDIGSSVDLSSWSAIELYLVHNTNRSAGTWTIRFYSDVGTTEIAGSEITIPSHAQSTCVARFDKRAALPSNVRSIAIETSVSIPAAATIRILSFAAMHSPHVTPNAITTTCIFSKSSWASGDWKKYGDKAVIHRCGGYVSDTRIFLGLSAAQAFAGWFGPNITISDTLYVYHAVFSTYCESSNNNEAIEPPEAGTAAARNSVSGGWNSTDMSTQGSEDITVIGFLTNLGRCWSGSVNQFYDWSRIFVIGTLGGTNGSSTNDRTFTDCGMINGVGLTLSGERCKYNGFIYGLGGSNGSVITLGVGCFASGLKFFGTANLMALSTNPASLFDDVTIINHASSALVASVNSSRSGHSIERVSVMTCASLLSAPTNNASDCVVGKVEYSMVGTIRSNVSDPGTVSVERFNGVDGDCRSWGPYHEISRVTDVVDGTATASMKVGIVSATAASANNPLRRLMFIYKHSSAYTAGQTISVSCRFRRSHATNIIPWLMVRGGSVVATDQKTAMTAAANTWETVTVSFTALASSEEIYIFWECSANTTATEFFHVNPESLTITVP